MTKRQRGKGVNVLAITFVNDGPAQLGKKLEKGDDNDYIYNNGDDGNEITVKNR